MKLLAVLLSITSVHAAVSSLIASNSPLATTQYMYGHSLSSNSTELIFFTLCEIDLVLEVTWSHSATLSEQFANGHSIRFIHCLRLQSQHWNLQLHSTRSCTLTATHFFSPCGIFQESQLILA